MPTGIATQSPDVKKANKSDEREVNELTVTSLSLLVSCWVASSGSDKSSRKFEGTKPRTPRSSPYKARKKANKCCANLTKEILTYHHLFDTYSLQTLLVQFMDNHVPNLKWRRLIAVHFPPAKLTFSGYCDFTHRKEAILVHASIHIDNISNSKLQFHLKNNR